MLMLYLKPFNNKIDEVFYTPLTTVSNPSTQIIKYYDPSIGQGIKPCLFYVQETNIEMSKVIISNQKKYFFCNKHSFRVTNHMNR